MNNCSTSKHVGDKRKITSGLIWSYGERIIAQTISLLISVILARILDPSEYGTISIVMIFITICDALVTGGFGNALVQKKNTDELDFSTILICSVGLSIILYIILYYSAPTIAEFYKMPLLIKVVRVLGLRIIITGINSIQQAKLQKAMEFKKFFFATLIGTVISAFVGICLALKGFGVWSLVAQYLTVSTINTLVLFITSKWIPQIKFSLQRAKVLLSYGWKVLVTTMVYTIEGNFRSLIIGKMFGASDLAYYDQGKRFPNLLVSNINTSISKVMLPALSENQDDLVRLKSMCRRSIKTGIFLLCPMLIGLIVIADTFVTVILTEKWIQCVPYLRIMTVVFLLRPLTTTSQQAIMAIGRSDITLKIEVILNVLAIVFLCIAIFGFQSILLIAYSNVATEFISLLLFMYYTNKLIDYKYNEQLRDILPSLSVSIFMGICIFAVGMLPIQSVLRFVIQIILGFIIYLFGAILLKIETLGYLLGMINEHFNNAALNILIYINKGRAFWFYWVHQLIIFIQSGRR